MELDGEDRRKKEEECKYYEAGIRCPYMIRGCKYVCYKVEKRDKEKESENISYKSSETEEGRKLKEEVGFLGQRMQDMMNKIHEMEKTKAVMTNPMGISWADVARMPSRGELLIPRSM